jgi:hypothetical protein
MTSKRFAGTAVALLAVFALAVACFVSIHQSPYAESFLSQVDNNPQKFHLWSTGSSFSYTFTCDPRAVDVWLFRSGGGMMFVLNPPPDWRPPLTNRPGW